MDTEGTGVRILNSACYRATTFLSVICDMVTGYIAKGRKKEKKK